MTSTYVSHPCLLNISLRIYRDGENRTEGWRFEIVILVENEEEHRGNWGMTYNYQTREVGMGYKTIYMEMN